MAITTTISTLPPAGKRGFQTRDDFVTTQEAFQDHLSQITVGELNGVIGQMNTTATQVTANASIASTKANEASASATLASSKATEASGSASTASTRANEASASAISASGSSAKASQWADNAYGTPVEVGKYSAKHWSTVAQNTLATKVDKVASTDNAIVRFNGTSGEVQNSGVIIDDNGNVGVGTSAPIHSISSYKAEGWNTGVGAQSGSRFIQLSADSNIGVDIFWSSNSFLRFSTGSSSDASGYTEIMRINTSGNLLVGTTIDNGVDKLQINGSISGTSFNSITGLSSTTPLMNGTATVGTGVTTARADHVHPSDTTKANLASPSFTGSPTAPTPTGGDSSTKLATTAFATGQDIGVGQTWQDMTASRAYGVTYTNNTGKPIMFSITTGTDVGIVSLNVNSIIVGYAMNADGILAAGGIIVPNGATYSANIVDGTPSVSWKELR